MNNPNFVNIALKVNNVSFVESQSDHLISLNYVEKSEGVGNFVIELYDDTARNVEEALLTSATGLITTETEQRVVGATGTGLVYAYDVVKKVQALSEVEFTVFYDDDDPDSNKVLHRKGTLTKITPEFRGEGMMLTLEGVSTAIASSINQIDVGFNVVADTTSFKVFAEKVLKNLSGTWNVITDENRFLVDEEATFVTSDKTTPLDVIRSLLIYIKVPEDQEVGSYNYRIDEKGDNVYDLYIYEEGLGETYDKLDKALGGAQKTYYVGGSSNNIISFSPSYDTFMRAHIGKGGGGTVRFYDPETDELYEQVITSEASDSDAAALTDTSGNLIYVKAISKTEAINLAKKQVAAMSVESYRATLEIIGDYQLQPWQEIKIINVLKDGRQHHTSGIYEITQVEHLIENGYTTTLSLIKKNS